MFYNCVLRQTAILAEKKVAGKHTPLLHSHLLPHCVRKWGLGTRLEFFTFTIVAFFRAETNSNESHEMFSSTEIFSKRQKIYWLLDQSADVTAAPQLS